MRLNSCASAIRGGIRIPKVILEQCGLQETADLQVERDCLVIARERRRRQDWEKAFVGQKGIRNSYVISLGLVQHYVLDEDLYCTDENYR